jgi:hypothetical protein
VTPNTPFALTITNTGAPPTAPAIDERAGAARAPDARATHPDDVRGHDDFDVFRISVAVDGPGWSAQLLNALAAVRAGDTSDLTVLVTPAGDAEREARVTVRAASESDPTKTAEAVWTVRR